MNMVWLDKIKKTISNNKRVLILALLGILGISLLGISEIVPKGHIQQAKHDEEFIQSSVQTDAYCQTLEKKLETILSEIENVGRVKVLLTLESSDEKIYATDKKTNSKHTDTSTEKTMDSKYVRDSKNTGEGMILKTNAPKIKGAVIVCDGGNNSAVVQYITAAVSAALGIGSNAVTVLKMKS